MNNLGPYGGTKNPAWSRPANTGSLAANNLVGQSMQSNAIQQQLMNQGGLTNMNAAAAASAAAGIVPFQQQQQVFQSMSAMQQQQQNLGLGLQQMPAVSLGGAIGTQLAQPNQLFQQVSTVTYPNPRALNAAAFQTQPQLPSIVQPANNNTSTKQRVFTGTVTTLHDNFGFIDEDIFFQTSVCVKGSNPVVGDRVLVEASYNARMPFKWNATRIQVLSNQQNSNRNSKNYSSSSSGYNAVPPPNDTANGNYGRNRAKASAGGRGRDRSRDRDREDDDNERKKRREERMKEMEKEDKKSPLRRRSRSPKSRRRSRIVPRYMVQIPKIALDLQSADVLETRRRYANLYIPSDFFNSNFRWMDAFPADKPFGLNKPCAFHIMHKDVDPINENDAILEPPDADYLFSAKVMLMSVPGIEELYQKCCAMAEDKEGRDYVHPTRLVNFLVGLRGKNETMAIGGPWSPSLDGADPDRDPSVLIKTAIRTCKALTGIDLSNCTKWYRFVELYYRRGAASSGAKALGARVQTVVIFLPDVWSCLPTRLEWDTLQLNYGQQMEKRLKADAVVAASAEGVAVDELQVAAAPAATAADQKDEEAVSADKSEPTHYSLLDPKVMGIADLRKELQARSLNSTGLKSQLVAKLAKALKSEAAKTEDNKEDENDDSEAAMDEKKSDTEEKKIDEKEKHQLEKRYTLPDQQHVIVHPSRTAKSGKFDCTVMSLSLLLDYRPEDTKEHSFEVSLFAELFNEMLMRDFGFNIYRALYNLPDKPKEKDEKRKKDDEKKKDEKAKSEDKDKKDDKDKKEKKKKDDKKSNSDEEDDTTEEDKDKKKDRKKRDKVKMFTKDRNLLLSFIYFDQTHCGYIFEKDIEDLLYTLGLNLSRAQVRKLVGKVITRDSLHYRKLTDSPKDEDFIVIDDSEKDINLEEIAIGNKRLLPVFGQEEITAKRVKLNDAEPADESGKGLVMFRGALVDISTLMAQLERSEKARLATEERMVDLKTENTKLLDKSTKANASIKTLNADLKECKDKLKITEDSLYRTVACSQLFQTTLIEIRDKIDPVINSTTSKEDIKKEETKTRWEKETKELKMEPDNLVVENAGDEVK